MRAQIAEKNCNGARRETQSTRGQGREVNDECSLLIFEVRSQTSTSKINNQHSTIINGFLVFLTFGP